MKKNVNKTLLQRIQDLKAKEINRPKMSLDDVEVVPEPEFDSFNIANKNNKQWIGNFSYMPARIDVPETGGYVQLPEFITMDMPYLEQPYRRRGIGEQMYKKIEEVTGKKILPDVNLSSYSSALHAKKGMGKSFGQAEYGPDIIKSLTEKLSKLGLSNPEKIAKKAFEKMKEDIQEKGVTNFKSIAPLLAKGAGTAVAGLASLAAEAADAKDEGSTLEEAAIQREKQEENFKKAVGEDTYYSSKQNMRNVSPMDLLDPMANKPQFRNLRNKLK